MVLLAMRSIVRNATQEAWLLTMRKSRRARPPNLIPRRRGSAVSRDREEDL
jgi:hypothetical protein